MMKKVLIGGGTGFIGRAITRTLAATGWDVWNISRSRGSSNTITWGEVERNGIPECDAVINLSGENAFVPFKRWNEEYKAIVLQSRVNTTRLLAQSIAATPHPPRTWIATSAEGYYPASKEKVFTEYSQVDSDDEGHNYFTEMCAKWEESGRLPEHCPTRHSIIRVGLALGRDGGLLKQFYLQYKLGLGGPVGAGDYYFSWIHLKDLARMYQFAIENDNVSGVLNGVAPSRTLQKEFAQTLGEVLSRPAILPTPGWVMSLMLGSERAGLVMSGKQILPQRVQDLGFNFHYQDLRTCLKDLV